MRLPTPWIATAVLLVGLGSDPGASPEQDPRGPGDRVPVADDPVSRLENAIVFSSTVEPVGEPVGDTADAPGLPPAARGPVRLLGLVLVCALAPRRRAVTRIESSPTRGPPGRRPPSIASFPLVPSRIDNIPLDPPDRWSTGRGPPA
jgi:hypothetical protein